MDTNIRKDKFVEISGGKLVAANASTASAAIIKANNARGVAVTALFLLDETTKNQIYG